METMMVENEAVAAGGNSEANFAVSEVAAAKFEALKLYLQGLKKIAVAFSGGVDSTFLLKVAHDVLGEGALALTAKSHMFPKRELEEAKAFCEREGIRQIVVESNELKLEGFAENPKNRCYLCKRGLFEKFRAVAAEHEIPYLAEGSNKDDDGDYRPGLKAVAELAVKSPLRYAGLTKAEIRELSRALNLPTWEKQSFACLSSRFVYGERITVEKLSMVDRAEQLLLDLGFRQLRVRIHGNDFARIEVMPGDFQRLLEHSELIVRELKAFGFTYVALDLQGYRTGSMNEALEGK